VGEARPSAAAPRTRLRPSRDVVRAEVYGGVSGAIASLALALSLGLLAFAPLGPDNAEIGVYAGFASAIYGQIIAGWLGGSSHPGSGPRASASLVLGGLVAALVRDPALAPGAPQGVAWVVALSGLAVVLAGVLQAVLGALRAGILARYVPYPFIAGFMTGASMLVILAQFTPLTGIPRDALVRDPAAAMHALQPATLAIGLGTAAIIWTVGRLVKAAPKSLVGLLAGSILYYGVAVAWPAAALGPVVGPVPSTLPLPTALAPLAGMPWDVFRAHLGDVLAAGAIIAVIGTLDGLFAAVAIDHATDGRHDARRELVAHGIANVASGLCGGVPVVLSGARALASWNAGSRTRASAVIAAVVLAFVLLFTGALLAKVPITVVGGIMLTLGVGLIDSWTHGLARRLRSPDERRDRTVRWSVATVVLVALTAVFLGFVPAIAVGLVLSGLLFVVGMNRSLVRSDVDATVRPSRRMWGGADAVRVREVRRRIRVIELEGALFFGSAERLSEAVEPLGGRVDAIVLDFRRVTTIDATGALLVERLSRRLARRGTRILLAGVSPGGRHGTAFVAYDAFRDPAQRLWFRDADQAVEWAESEALKASARPARPEVPLGEFPLFADLSPAELDDVGARLARRTYAAGDALFREGDPGDRLCLLAHGAVEISIRGADGSRVRLVTMAEGSLFGEAALLDGRPRSASATAVEATIVYELSRVALDSLAERTPAIAIRIVTNLARIMSTRMRETNEILRQLEDSRG
jgi:MFS superfamily sulfate permease-like transporter